jgi:hypothetical protein
MSSASSSASEPHPLGGAAAQPSRPPRHAGRSATEELPEPKLKPGASSAHQWYVHALVSRKGTGKATSTLQEEFSPLMFAPTREAALERQRAFIEGYLHPKPRAAARKRSAPAEAVQPRSQRAAAPRELAEPSCPRGPQPGHGRAGPGRGHTYESTAGLAYESTVRVNPIDAADRGPARSGAGADAGRELAPAAGEGEEVEDRPHRGTRAAGITII